MVASRMPPVEDLVLNPGMCPDWELNQQPFGLQAGTQSTEPHQPRWREGFLTCRFPLPICWGDWRESTGQINLLVFGQKIPDWLIKIMFLGEVETAVRSGVKSSFGPGQVAQLVGVLSHTPKGCRFNFQSGHAPRLRVQSQVGACTQGNRVIVPPHVYVSLSLSLSFSSLLSKNK